MKLTDKFNQNPQGTLADHSHRYALLNGQVVEAFKSIDKQTIASFRRESQKNREIALRCMILHVAFELFKRRFRWEDGSPVNGICCSKCLVESVQTLTALCVNSVPDTMPFTWQEVYSVGGRMEPVMIQAGMAIFPKMTHPSDETDLKKTDPQTYYRESGTGPRADAQGSQDGLSDSEEEVSPEDLAKVIGSFLAAVIFGNGGNGR